MDVAMEPLLTGLYFIRYLFRVCDFFPPFIVRIHFSFSLRQILDTLWQPSTVNHQLIHRISNLEASYAEVVERLERVEKEQG